MSRILAAIVLAVSLAGCVYGYGGGYSSYPQTTGPQGDTPGAVAGD